MSTREDSEREKNCPIRGLGVAAAAIGVGVGAALFYYLTKRTENPNVPDGEGATSSWNCEQSQSLINSSEEDESYTTISEHSTSDTSMHDTSADTSSDNTSDSNMTPDIANSDSNDTSVLNSSSAASSNSDVSLDSPDGSPFSDLALDREPSIEEEMDNWMEFFNENVPNESDWEDYDSDEEYAVVHNPNYVPNAMRSRFAMLVDNLAAWASPTQERPPAAEEQRAILRDQAFRQRSWSPEECSICFDVMLQHDIVMSLPCTHRFHQHCILPWLQERQTCPNCRKMAECPGPGGRRAAAAAAAEVDPYEEEDYPVQDAYSLIPTWQGGTWALPPETQAAFRRQELNRNAML